MYIQQLATFIQVAEAGSFGKAAEILFISTPAIVQQINLLEERCGFPLFNRSNRGVSLTPAGQSLYEDGKKIIALSDRALERAKQIFEDSLMTIKIGSSPIFRARVLIDTMNMTREDELQFHYEIPNLVSELSQFKQFELLGNQCDLLEAIFCDLAWADQCQFFELFQTPICIAVNQLHPLAKKKKVFLEDILPYTIILAREGAISQLDALRKDLQDLDPDITVQDAQTIGQDLISMTEVQPYIFITQKIFQDNHPSLVTIPLDTPHTLPYGFLYAKEPSQATLDFLYYVNENKEELIAKWQ
ncbi:transcriptional regulator [Streptococcus oralis subsp. tigurinus]|uniref:Transcriptional regulator n=2 Tax=Bacteria TaxID=2 RepID=A0A1X0X172_STROR|nr:LysR family transcriptional regulator [Streptococcus oralis]ORJ32689.1 transcriptional regulator [Streptococcus oralis subsp. tigurinus]